MFEMGLSKKYSETNEMYEIRILYLKIGTKNLISV